MNLSLNKELKKDLKIKICGLTRDCDIDFVNKYLPDYVGFVFYNKSKRFIELENAKILCNKLDKKIKSVGVFVNPEIDYILQFDFLDFVQLHGDESAEKVSEIADKLRKNNSKIKIIKVFFEIFLKDINAIENLSKYKDCEYFLFDSPGGGTGLKFDWNLLENIKQNLNTPFFIAGGINLENLDESINFAHKIGAFGLDLSGGAETNGFKDEEKIKKIITEIKKD